MGQIALDASELVDLGRIFRAFSHFLSVLVKLLEIFMPLRVLKIFEEAALSIRLSPANVLVLHLI